MVEGWASCFKIYYYIAIITRNSPLLQQVNRQIPYQLCNGWCAFKSRMLTCMPNCIWIR